MSKLTNDEVFNYLESINIDKSEYTCRDCGKLATWNNAEFSLVPSMSFRGKDYSKEKFKRLTYVGVSFAYPRRTYNNNEYHLCYCYDCACKHFPEIPSKHFPLQPASNRSKFLYGISDEDFSGITSKVCKRTKEGYIEKFGEEEGLKRWNSYCNKQAVTNTFEYKKAKYGWTKDQFDEFNRSRSCTLENFIKRHGEIEGTRKWNEYCEIQRYTTTLEYFQKTYGEIEGKEKWEAYQKAKSPITLKIVAHSKIADNMFLELSKFFKGNEIYTETLNEEYNLNDVFKLDYYDKTLNVAVEFYGDYWHCNPNHFKSDEKLSPIFKNGEYVKDIWDYDKKRQEYVEKSLKTKMFIVWEEDYRHNKKKTIEDLVKKINEYVELRNSINQSSSSTIQST